MTTARPMNHMVGLHSTVSDCMFLTYQQPHALDHKKSTGKAPLAGTSRKYLRPAPFPLFPHIRSGAAAPAGAGAAHPAGKSLFTVFLA